MKLVLILILKLKTFNLFNIMRNLPHKIYLFLIVIFCLVSLNSQYFYVFAQNLDSTNYRIEDPTIDSGGGATDSSNYSFLQSLGYPNADARLTSGSYELKSGFPNGILANVPKVTCFETDTTSGTTDCLYFPTQGP